MTVDVPANPNLLAIRWTTQVLIAVGKVQHQSTAWMI
jgi:hypothetical protein